MWKKISLCSDNHIFTQNTFSFSTSCGFMTRCLALSYGRHFSYRRGFLILSINHWRIACEESSSCKVPATISDYILLLQEPVVFGFLHHSHQQISPVVLLESNLVIM